jgi:hypothetical protein
MMFSRSLLYSHLFTPSGSYLEEPYRDKASHNSACNMPLADEVRAKYWQLLQKQQFNTVIDGEECTLKWNKIDWPPTAVRRYSRYVLMDENGNNRFNLVANGPKRPLEPRELIEVFSRPDEPDTMADVDDLPWWLAADRDSSDSFRRARLTKLQYRQPAPQLTLWFRQWDPSGDASGTTLLGTEHSCHPYPISDSKPSYVQPDIPWSKSLFDPAGHWDQPPPHAQGALAEIVDESDAPSKITRSRGAWDSEGISTLTYEESVQPFDVGERDDDPGNDAQRSFVIAEGDSWNDLWFDGGASYTIALCRRAMSMTVLGRNASLEFVACFTHPIS